MEDSIFSGNIFFPQKYVPLNYFSKDLNLIFTPFSILYANRRCRSAELIVDTKESNNTTYLSSSTISGESHPVISRVLSFLGSCIPLKKKKKYKDMG